LAGTRIRRETFDVCGENGDVSAVLAFEQRRENPLTAEDTMGIPVERMVALSFALSAGLGALAGVVVTPLITTQFNIGLPFTLKGFAAAVIGGLGNIGGAIVGGLLLGVLEALSTAFVSSMYGDAVTYGILLVILLVRPSGLFRPLVELTQEEL